MLSQLTIPKKKTQELALDYQQLYAIGLKYVQQLSSKIWTDYNYSNPGITILELLCYAHTDLSYRASFPIEDLLASETNNAEEMKKQFFTARQILPNRPLTLLDYRKLLIDIKIELEVGEKQKAVKNAWLKPATLSYYADIVNPYNAEDIVDSPRLGCATLFVDDLINLPSLATKLKQPSDSDKVSQYFKGRLSNKTQQVLAAYQDADENVLLKTLLIHNLNKIIQDTVVKNGVIHSVLLYEQQRFASVTLSTEILSFLESKIREEDIERLNRMLLEDAYPQEIAKNQWLRDKSNLQNIKKVNLTGLYEVKIEYEDAITTIENEIKKAEAKQKAIQAVQQKLQANRNLCEDFVLFTEVEIQSFQLCAEIELTPDADVTEVNAAILFQVQQYLSPTVRLYTLSKMLSRTKADGTPYTVDEIFDGPALDSGFIDDDELENADLRTEIRLSDIISIIMDIEGVQAVRDIVINPEGNKVPLVNKWVIPVETGKQAKLKPDVSRLVFYKRNLPVVPSNVQNEASTVTPIKEVKNDLEIPLGTYRELASYYSFQNHFPAIYGLSDVGLSSAADDKRKALAYQLKAYLLFFDQVMANYFAQLSHVKELFSINPDLKQTYFYQVVNSFADYNKIYATNNVIDTLQTQNSDREAAKGFDRRNRFLDHLISRFAERFNDFVNILYSEFNESPENIIRDKCEFLENYPTISQERSLAYNYSLQEDKDLWNTDNVSGLEKRLAKLLGIHNHRRRNLSTSNEEGMYLIENILMRPEQNTDPFLPICPTQNCSDCAEADPYSYRINIILPAYSGHFSNMKFRRFAEEIIRQETPAHILPKICWINKDDMAELEKLYRDWIYLKAGVEKADREDKLKKFIKKLFAVKSVYPPQKLSDCNSSGEQPKFILGQTALGTGKTIET